MIDKKAQKVIDSSINKIIEELQRNKILVCSRKWNIDNSLSSDEPVRISLDINIDGVILNED